MLEIDKKYLERDAEGAYFDLHRSDAEHLYLTVKMKCLCGCHRWVRQNHGRIKVDDIVYGREWVEKVNARIEASYV